LTKKEQQSKCLANIGNVSSSLAPSPKSQIAIIPGREFITVNTEKCVPDQISRVARHYSKDSIQNDAFVIVRRYTRENGGKREASPGPHPNVPMENPTPYGPRMSVVIR
jgi:hypothetical protein